jgi:hypothetical protein
MGFEIHRLRDDRRHRKSCKEQTVSHLAPQWLFIDSSYRLHAGRYDIPVDIVEEGIIIAGCKARTDK